jgi:hypothetical protein
VYKIRISTGADATLDAEADELADALVVMGVRVAVCEEGDVHDNTIDATGRLETTMSVSARAMETEREEDPGTTGIPSGYFFGGGVSRSSAR